MTRHIRTLLAVAGTAAALIAIGVAGLSVARANGTVIDLGGGYAKCGNLEQCLRDVLFDLDSRNVEGLFIYQDAVGKFESVTTTGFYVFLRDPATGTITQHAASPSSFRISNDQTQAQWRFSGYTIPADRAFHGIRIEGNRRPVGGTPRNFVCELGGYVTAD